MNIQRHLRERNAFTGLDKQLYIKELNRAYAPWGDEALFDWAFLRCDSLPTPEIFTFREEEKYRAGSALTWRRLRVGDRVLTAGIITGSWTAPEMRGRGLFSAMIRASLNSVREQGADLLAAFVTASNGSFRCLAAAGAQLIPAWYLFGEESTTNSSSLPVEECPTDWDVLYRTRAATSLLYTRKEFEQQYGADPSGLRHVRVGNESLLLRETYNVTKVLYHSCTDSALLTEVIDALQAWRLENGMKPLFLFTLNPLLAGRLRQRGFRPLKGFLTILPAAGEINAPIAVPLRIQMGDKM